MELKMNFSTTYFFLINILFFALSFFMSYLLKKKKAPSLPGEVDLNYYEKAYLYKGPNFIYNPIIAMILKSYGHGNIEIEKNTYRTKRGEEKLEFILKNLRDSGLQEGEKKLFKTLFSLGQGDTISTREMDRLRRTEADNYNKKFNDFIYYLEDDMVAKKLFSREKNTLKIFLSFVIFSILFFVGLITVYNENFFGIGSLVASLFFYASLLASFSKMTDLGNKKFRELEKVEEGLLSSKGDSLDDFLLAISFGLKKENIRVIYENFIQKNPGENNFQIFFHEDFYKTFKRALVGDHLIVRN